MVTGIQFDEDKMGYGQKQYLNQMGKTQPKMVQWLMDKGIAKSPASAQGILFGVMVGAFIVALLVVF